MWWCLLVQFLTMIPMMAAGSDARSSSLPWSAVMLWKDVRNPARAPSVIQLGDHSRVGNGLSAVVRWHVQMGLSTKLWLYILGTTSWTFTWPGNFRGQQYTDIWERIHPQSISSWTTTSPGLVTNILCDFWTPIHLQADLWYCRLLEPAGPIGLPQFGLSGWTTKDGLSPSSYHSLVREACNVSEPSMYYWRENGAAHGFYSAARSRTCSIHSYQSTSHSGEASGALTLSIIALCVNVQLWWNHDPSNAPKNRSAGITTGSWIYPRQCNYWKQKGINNKSEWVRVFSSRFTIFNF